MSRIRAAILALALSVPVPALSQEVVMSLICDLGGAPAQMIMGIHYQQAFGYSVDSLDNISGVFPVGVNVYVGGEIASATGRYSFRGENNFADFIDLVSGDTFRVEWVLDPARNGLWMKVNPFGDTTIHFCQFQGAQPRAVVR